MSLPRFLRAGALLAAAFLVSCGNSVNLDPARAGEVAKMSIDPSVKRPEKLAYTDKGAQAAALPLMLVGGAVGGLAGGAIAEGMNADNRTELERMIAGTVGDAGKPLRKAMENSLRRKKVATVVAGGATSRLTLEFKGLGLLPLGGITSQMQVVMNVEATLAANDGTVLWRTNYSTTPHNEELPARTYEEYRANHSLFAKDLEAACGYVTDLLADDLKGQLPSD